VIAKIIPFKAKKTRVKKKNLAPTTTSKSNVEIFRDVLDDVLGKWQEKATKNELESYLASVIQSKKKIKSIHDLNALSKIERDLEIKVAIFYPGCTSSTQLGWMAAFHVGKETYCTPSDMASESYARTINIILYVTFEKTLKTM
jgi:hypothetical protein